MMDRCNTGGTKQAVVTLSCAKPLRLLRTWQAKVFFFPLSVSSFRWGKSSRSWEPVATGCGRQSATSRWGWMSWRASREPWGSAWVRSCTKRPDCPTWAQGDERSPAWEPSEWDQDHTQQAKHSGGRHTQYFCSKVQGISTNMWIWNRAKD